MKKLLLFLMILICMPIIGVPLYRHAKKVVVSSIYNKEIIYTTDSVERVFEVNDTIKIKMIDGKFKKFYPSKKYLWYYDVSTITYTIE